MQDRQKLLHEKEGRADIDGEEVVEILYRILLDRCGLRCACIGDEDIQAIAHDGANLFGELVRPVRRCQIRGDYVAAAAGLADFRNDDFSLLCTASVVHEHLGTGPG
jgi:hypothetical protein